MMRASEDLTFSHSCSGVRSKLWSTLPKASSRDRPAQVAVEAIQLTSGADLT